MLGSNQNCSHSKDVYSSHHWNTCNFLEVDSFPSSPISELTTFFRNELFKLAEIFFLIYYYSSGIAILIFFSSLGEEKKSWIAINITVPRLAKKLQFHFLHTPSRMVYFDVRLKAGNIFSFYNWQLVKKWFKKSRNSLKSNRLL